MVTMKSQVVHPKVRASLESLREEVASRPPSSERIRLIIKDLLMFLASHAGRTDANCRAVDSALMNYDALWEHIDLVEASDPTLADVLRDMAGALHDTVSAPHVAGNFDSTPEQLLKRLG